MSTTYLLAVHIFPVHLFNPANVKSSIDGRVITGGESINGEVDTIATDGGGRWQVTYSGIDLTNPRVQRQWEAWEAYLDGGAVDCLVPVLSLARANRPFGGGYPARVHSLVYDDALFPTTLSYAAPYISATLSASASLRATELTINVTRGAPLEGGETFSIDGRAYRIARVKSRPSVQSAVVDIRPPLRSALTIGDSLDFSFPAVKCRMQPNQDVGLDIFQNKTSSASILFFEDTI